MSVYDCILAFLLGFGVCYLFILFRTTTKTHRQMSDKELDEAIEEAEEIYTQADDALTELLNEQTRRNNSEP